MLNLIITIFTILVLVLGLQFTYFGFKNKKHQLMYEGFQLIIISALYLLLLSI